MAAIGFHTRSEMSDFVKRQKASLALKIKLQKRLETARKGQSATALLGMPPPIAHVETRAQVSAATSAAIDVARAHLRRYVASDAVDAAATWLRDSGALEEFNRLSGEFGSFVGTRHDIVLSIFKSLWAEFLASRQPSRVEDLILRKLAALERVSGMSQDILSKVGRISMMYLDKAKPRLDEAFQAATDAKIAEYEAERTRLEAAEVDLNRHRDQLKIDYETDEKAFINENDPDVKRQISARMDALAGEQVAVTEKLADIERQLRTLVKPSVDPQGYADAMERDALKDIIKIIDYTAEQVAADKEVKLTQFLNTRAKELAAEVAGVAAARKGESATRAKEINDLEAEIAAEKARQASIAETVRIGAARLKAAERAAQEKLYAKLTQSQIDQRNRELNDLKSQLKADRVAAAASKIALAKLEAELDAVSSGKHRRQRSAPTVLPFVPETISAPPQLETKEDSEFEPLETPRAVDSLKSSPKAPKQRTPQPQSPASTNSLLSGDENSLLESKDDTTVAQTQASDIGDIRGTKGGEALYRRFFSNLEIPDDASYVSQERSKGSAQRALKSNILAALGLRPDDNNGYPYEMKKAEYHRTGNGKAPVINRPDVYKGFIYEAGRTLPAVDTYFTALKLKYRKDPDAIARIKDVFGVDLGLNSGSGMRHQATSKPYHGPQCYRFGNLGISRAALHKCHLQLHSASGGRIYHYFSPAERAISPQLAELILYACHHPDADVEIHQGYLALNPEDQHVFDRLRRYAKYVPTSRDAHKIRRSEAALDKKFAEDHHRWKLLTGEAMAGNDSPKILRELKHVAMRLHNGGRMTTRDFQNAMYLIAQLSV